MAKAATRLEEAIHGIKPFIDRLRDLKAQCMEQVTDKRFGIITERWLLPSGVSVIVYGTPIWRDVYVPAASSSRTYEEALAPLDALAKT